MLPRNTYTLVCARFDRLPFFQRVKPKWKRNWIRISRHQSMVYIYVYIAKIVALAHWYVNVCCEHRMAEDISTKKRMRKKIPPTKRRMNRRGTTKSVCCLRRSDCSTTTPFTPPPAPHSARDTVCFARPTRRTTLCGDRPTDEEPAARKTQNLRLMG